MRLKKKVDSTEQLLDIIRNGEDRPPADESPAPKKKRKPGLLAAAKPKISPVRLRGVRNAVGVDIREDSLDVVRLAGGKLSAFERLPLDAGSGPGKPGFIPVLRDTLKRHCGLGRKAEIWALFHSGEFDIGPTLIPKVPARKINETVFWTLQKEKKFEDKDSILDFRVLGPMRESGVPKIEVLTCLASRPEVERLKALFAEAGFGLTGIVTIPEAVQNVYRSGLVACTMGLCANIHVDASFSCITIHTSDKILFSRTFKSGTNSMAEALIESLSATHPGIQLDQAHKILFSCLFGQPLDECFRDIAISEGEAFEVIGAALERLVRQVERTLDFYATKHNARCDVLHLSGEVFAGGRIREYLSSQLGIQGEMFDPLGTVQNEHADSDLHERIRATLPLAAAMSESSQTLNLAFTYKERGRARKEATLSDMVAAAAILLALALSVAFLAEKVVARQKRDTLTRLEQKVAQYSPLVDEQKLVALAGEVIKTQNEIKAFGKRYETLAVLSEVAALTPENVRLLNLSMDFGRSSPPAQDKAQPAPAPPQAPGKKPEGPVSRVVVLDGIVLGQSAELERTLTRFVINLEGSPLFKTPEIRNSQVQDFVPEGKVLHFVLQVGLV